MGQISCCDQRVKSNADTNDTTSGRRSTVHGADIIPSLPHLPPARVPPKESLIALPLGDEWVDSTTYKPFDSSSPLIHDRSVRLMVYHIACDGTDPKHIAARIQLARWFIADNDTRDFPLGRYLYQAKKPHWYTSTHTNFSNTAFATSEADKKKVAAAKKQPTEYMIDDDDKLDITKAMLWWEMAVQRHGSLDALYALGIIYGSHLIPELNRDARRSAAYIQRVAMYQSSSSSLASDAEKVQVPGGSWYRHGCYVAEHRDITKAMEWFEYGARASPTGGLHFGWCCEALASYYHYHRRPQQWTRPDEVHALKWYLRGADMAAYQYHRSTVPTTTTTATLMPLSAASVHCVREASRFLAVGTGGREPFADVKEGDDIISDEDDEEKADHTTVTNGDSGATEIKQQSKISGFQDGDDIIIGGPKPKKPLWPWGFTADQGRSLYYATLAAQLDDTDTTTMWQVARTYDGADGTAAVIGEHKTASGSLVDRSKAAYWYGRCALSSMVEAREAWCLALLRQPIPVATDTARIHEDTRARELLTPGDITKEVVTAAFCNIMGMYSEQGRGGIPRDLVKAVAWYQRAVIGDTAGTTDALTDRSHIPTYAYYNYARAIWNNIGGMKRDISRAYINIIKAKDSHTHIWCDDDAKKLNDTIHMAAKKANLLDEADGLKHG